MLCECQEYAIELGNVIETFEGEGFVTVSYIERYCDDTADLNRAVVISDAYYGDVSSVVQVYQETGKPIMIQNVDIR